MNIKPVRGTYDLYDGEMQIHNSVLENLEEVVKVYDFTQIKTPIIENTELFRRTSGEASDIVQKEMYDFEDKGGRSLTLRPELTAGTARAFISNKIYGERLPNYKYFYYGEAFRYERPQSLRYRQFYQFGVEYFGEKDPHSDVETIGLAQQIVDRFSLGDKVTLKINTIGTIKERAEYNELLYKYFEDSKDSLCEECQAKLELNPIKILDCKHENNSELFKNVPRLKAVLSDETLENYKEILGLLDTLGIGYEEDETLVRGLDYYNGVVFEFVYKYGREEKTIIAGGRYDGLVKELGGPDTPAVGFGIGMERLIEAVRETIDVEELGKHEVDVYYINLTNETFTLSLQSMSKLRSEGINCQSNFSDRSFKSQMKLAVRENAVFAVILDAESLETNEVRVRNLISKDEGRVKLQDFEDDIIGG